MFNRAGKILSILAMMAVAINAQCALSCSLQAAQPAKPDAHSCCKEHKSTASHTPKPCPETVLALADSHKSQAPHYFAVAIVYRFEATQPVTRRVPGPAAEVHKIPPTPAFSILRV